MKKIDELYDGDKPREKLMKKGAKALKSYELVAAILGSGVRGRDVLGISREIVKVLESCEGGVVEPEALMRIHGLGEAKAAQIAAAVELGIRRVEKGRQKIDSAQKVWEVLKEYGCKRQEYFLAVTLDGASGMIAKRVISIGTLNQSLVHPREVFADAIAERAAGIVVAHNHPSGQCFPSREDRRVTQRLAEAGRLLGIELLDHVIITLEGYYSFSEEGEI